MAAVNQANPIGSSTAQTLSTSDGNYLAPVIAQMFADASGEYGVLQRTKVTITNINKIFGYRLSEEQSVKLMNLFRVTDTDVSGIANTLDSSAEVDVSLNLAGADAENFRSMIREALTAAETQDQVQAINSGVPGTAYRTVTDWLAFEAYKDTVESLKYDTLANMLGADDLAAFSMRLDVCGAAISLVSQLNDASPAQRKALFTQFPEANIEKYLFPVTDISGLQSAEAISDIKFLPFVVGDRFYCVFDTTIGQAALKEDGTRENPTLGPSVVRVDADNSPASGQTAQAGAVGGSVTAPLANGEYDNGASLRFSAPTRRRIALALILSRETTAAASNDINGDATELTDAGEGFKMAFVPKAAYGGAGTYVIDPQDEAYQLMVASGMLHDLSEQLIVTADDAPAHSEYAHSLEDISADLLVKMADISDGVNWQELKTGLSGVTADSVYGRFVFVPSAAAGESANEVRISHVEGGNTWMVEINALSTGLTKGDLYYVENSGRYVQANLSVNHTWAQDA